MRELEKREVKSFGKTSQPSPKAFLDKYKTQFEKFEKIICITITSKLSGTYNSAVQAKNFLAPEDESKIFVVDSLNASGGEGILVLKAIELIGSGKTIEEIVKELELFVPKVRFFVMFPDPKWLEASGRISHLIANLLRGLAKRGIRPLMTFKNGKLVPASLKMGASDAVIIFLKQLKKETQNLREVDKKIRVAITHGDDLKSALRLKEMIEKEFSGAEIAFINIINNIVGALTGPDTLTLSWCPAEI